jgi:microcystin degradation protein MlrC
MKRLILLLLVLMVPTMHGAQPRIAVAGISHESNSFNSAKTGLEDFDSAFPFSVPAGATRPESLAMKTAGARAQFLSEAAKANTTVSGYVEGAQRLGLDLYPLLVTDATPKGPVTDHAFNSMMEVMIRELKAAPPLDGVLLALHGAMVVESYPSGDAEIVRRVREALGPSMPIIVTHDFHANVTPEIVKLSNALITYKETPHIDTKERGVQAAEIMAGMVTRKVKPVQAIVKPPMIYNLVFQYTKALPLLPIVDESKRLEKDPKILAVSVSGGYQWADVPSVGPSVIVVTDNDPGLAQREAQRLSDMLWATRDQLVLKEPDPAKAVQQAMQAKKFPAVLVDMGDNVGGGSPGDSTFVLEELVRQKAQGWVVVIADPKAADVAFQAGVGGAFDLPVGAKADNEHGKPVRIRGRVRSLHEGQYVETEIRHGGGRYWDMGHTAVILVEGSTLDVPNLVLLTKLRSSPNSIHQLVSNGVYIERQKIIVVKGTIAPRAAWEPVAGVMIPVDSPGATAVNPARFKFTRARRPLFGLE